jgi:hypothetical protein
VIKKKKRKKGGNGDMHELLGVKKIKTKEKRAKVKCVVRIDFV